MYGITAICWVLGAWYTCRGYLGGARATRPGPLARLLYAPEARPRGQDHETPPRFVPPPRSA